MSEAQPAGVPTAPHRRDVIMDGLRRRVPIMDWLPKYDRSRLRTDLIAGSVVAALAVPQALGYAAIAGVPVELGLYAVPIALIAYAIFGSSRQLIVGPVSTVSVLSGSLVAALEPGSVVQAITYTTAAALWAGVILLVAANLKVGWVAEFLSKPIVTGFVLGLTLLVILGEVPGLLGIKITARDVLGRIEGLARGIGQVDPLTMAISAVALLILFAGSALLPRIPWSLVVLVLGLVGSKILDLGERGVAVVGAVPAGLPGPQLPIVPVDRIADIALAGAALGFVGLAEGLSAARLFAVKRDYRVRTDQELFAAGAANLATGLLGGMAVAGSLSKTAAVDRSGGRTQAAGLAAAVLSILVILFFAPALGLLPKAVLSAIVVHAVWGLIDIPAMRRYRHSRRVDFFSAWAAVVGVLVFGPLLGLLVAIGWAILGLVYRSSRVTVDVMGKVPGEKAAWGSLENHPERVTIPGILVLRVNESLFWVNAARVKERVLEIVDEHPDIKAVVLDLESSDQLEITSTDMLALLIERLRNNGIDVYLVRVRFRVRTVLRRTGVRQELGDDHLWHSISQGVRAARDDHGLRPAKPTEGGGVLVPVRVFAESSGVLELYRPETPLVAPSSPLREGSGTPSSPEPSRSRPLSHSARVRGVRNAPDAALPDTAADGVPDESGELDDSDIEQPAGERVVLADRSDSRDREDHDEPPDPYEDLLDDDGPEIVLAHSEDEEITADEEENEREEKHRQKSEKRKHKGKGKKHKAKGKKRH